MIKIQTIKKVLSVIILSLNNLNIIDIYEKIISKYEYYSMPTLIEYQLFISEIREAYKKDSLDILEKYDKSDKLLLKDLKDMGVYNYMDEKS